MEVTGWIKNLSMEGVYHPLPRHTAERFTTASLLDNTEPAGSSAVDYSRVSIKTWGFYWNSLQCI